MAGSLHNFIALLLSFSTSSLEIDLTPGNFWNAHVGNQWERDFIQKLGDLASTYDLKAWYDIMWGGHYYIPHVGPLWHLQLPMELVYATPDDYGQSETGWELQKKVVEARGLGSKIREHRVTKLDVKKHLNKEKGHLLVTPNIPQAWGFEFDWTYDAGANPPYYHKAYCLMHGIDEDGIYFGNEAAGRWVPLNFGNYFRANQYKSGPLAKDVLYEVAGFTDLSKPLLVYFGTYDDSAGPKWDSEDGSGDRHASALFSNSEASEASHWRKAPLFDLNELSRLSETYNVVVRPHPHCYNDPTSAQTMEELRNMTSTSFYLDAEADPKKRFDYTDWYEHSNALVVELSATSTAAMVLAKDKPIVFMRRLENDKKLRERANKLMTDDMLVGWRPQQGESLASAIQKAVAQMEGPTKNDIINLREQYNQVLYRCPLNGYEEYATMLALLARLDLGSQYQHKVKELKEIYLRDEFTWCDPLPAENSSWPWWCWLLLVILIVILIAGLAALFHRINCRSRARTPSSLDDGSARQTQLVEKDTWQDCDIEN